jgi:hypothetical protein
LKEASLLRAAVSNNADKTQQLRLRIGAPLANWPINRILTFFVARTEVIEIALL